MLKKISLILLLAFVFSSCTKDAAQELVNEERSFYMGTTPWPADLTQNEVGETYNFISNHCDIVAHHFDEGIPFEEAFTGVAMPVNVLNNVNFRRNNTAPNKKVFLSVAALSINRVSKASYYNEASTSKKVKEYWENLSFDDPKVITAYTNYLDWLIEQFQPIYVNYGVESNAMHWDTIEFLKYRKFLSQVYQNLRKKHPKIPFFVSFIVDESPQSFNHAKELLAYTDFIALSAYPYLGINTSANGDTNPAYLSSNYFERYTNLSTTKPLVVSETGYIAEDLQIPGLSIDKKGNEDWQNNYLKKILSICALKKAKMIIWFCPKDYNALVTYFQNQGASQATLDILSIWKDTGLIDEKNKKRPAYFTWLDWMKKEKK